MRLHNLVPALLVAGTLAPATGTPYTPMPPGPAGNSIGIRLVDAPFKTRADSRSWRYIIDHLAPGAVIRRRVEVSNTTRHHQRLSVYPAAAEIRDRRFRFGPGRTANELSAWTSMNRHEMTLPPQSRSMVTTTITVPEDAAPGERYAMIWAEVAKDPPPGGGIRQIRRVGVRMYLSVGGDNAPAANFTIDSLTPQRTANGLQMITAQVHNTGGRAVDLSGDLKLMDGPGHLTAGPFKIQTGTTLAPGDSGTVTALLGEEVPDGPWRARIRLESGLTKRSAEALIRFPSAPGVAKAVKVKMDSNGHAVVALVIGAVLSALAAAALLLFHRNRRSRQTPTQA